MYYSSYTILYLDIVLAHRGLFLEIRDYFNSCGLLGSESVILLPFARDRLAARRATCGGICRGTLGAPRRPRRRRRRPWPSAARCGRRRRGSPSAARRRSWTGRRSPRAPRPAEKSAPQSANGGFGFWLRLVIRVVSCGQFLQYIFFNFPILHRCKSFPYAHTGSHHTQLAISTGMRGR